jgi:hypothetical protein
MDNSSELSDTEFYHHVADLLIKMAEGTFGLALFCSAKNIYGLQSSFFLREWFNWPLPRRGSAAVTLVTRSVDEEAPHDPPAANPSTVSPCHGAFPNAAAPVPTIKYFKPSSLIYVDERGVPRPLVYPVEQPNEHQPVQFPCVIRRL